MINKVESVDHNLATQFLNHLKDKVKNRRNVNLISLIKYLHNPETHDGDDNWTNCSNMQLIKFTEQLYNRLFGLLPIPNASTSENNDSDTDIQIADTQHDNQQDPTVSFELQLKMAIDTAASSSGRNVTHAREVSRNLIKKVPTF